MGIDNLITIGVIIYVIYSIKKVISGEKKEDRTIAGQSKQKKGGWAKKLDDFINTVKEEIEKANQEPAPQQTSYEKEDDDFFWDEVRESAPGKIEIPTQTIPFEHGNKSSDGDRIPELPLDPDENHRNYHGSHDKPGKVFGYRENNKPRIKMRKCDLKKAVIWSEILSKPVGLRDEV